MRRRPEETSQRILAAASKLFYTTGIRATGVNAIARAAGVTKRTLYHHYESKDALIIAYLQAQNEPILAALIKSITRVSGDVTQQIEGLFMMFARQATVSNWHGCPFARAVSEFRNANENSISSVAAAHKETFESWLADHLRSCEVTESELLARQLMVLIDGTIIQLLIHHDASYAVAAAKAAVSLVKARLSE